MSEVFKRHTSVTLGNIVTSAVGVAAAFVFGCTGAGVTPFADPAGGGNPNVETASKGASPPDAAARSGEQTLAANQLPVGNPMDTESRVWSFVPFADAACADGTSTGLALNPVPHAKGLVLYLPGGGACWDAETCLDEGRAVDVTHPMGEVETLAEVLPIQGPLERNNTANPYRDFAYAYIPYCTGDFYAGTRVATVQHLGVATTLSFVGANDVDAYLARLAPTFPEVDHVVVIGFSAGGFGAILNWWRVQAAFPHARVDVLDDSGPPVDFEPERFAMVSATWGLSTPPGCTACKTHLSALLPFYATALPSPRRFGLFASLEDSILESYLNIEESEFTAELFALRAQQGNNQKSFFLNNNGHIVFFQLRQTTSSGESALDWADAFASDDPRWANAGP